MGVCLSCVSLRGRSYTSTVGRIRVDAVDGQSSYTNPDDPATAATATGTPMTHSGSHLLGPPSSTPQTQRTLASPSPQPSPEPMMLRAVHVPDTEIPTVPATSFLPPPASLSCSPLVEAKMDGHPFPPPADLSAIPSTLGSGTQPIPLPLPTTVAVRGGAEAHVVASHATNAGTMVDTSSNAACSAGVKRPHNVPPIPTHLLSSGQTVFVSKEHAGSVSATTTLSVAEDGQRPSVSIQAQDPICSELKRMHGTYQQGGSEQKGTMLSVEPIKSLRNNGRSHSAGSYLDPVAIPPAASPSNQLSQTFHVDQFTHPSLALSQVAGPSSTSTTPSEKGRHIYIGGPLGTAMMPIPAVTAAMLQGVNGEDVDPTKQPYNGQPFVLVGMIDLRDSTRHHGNSSRRGTGDQPFPALAMLQGGT